MNSADRNFYSALKFALILIVAWGLFVWFIIATGSGSSTVVSTALPGGVRFALPADFYTESETFEGNEIEYHLNLKRSDGLVYGYFQIVYVGTELATADGLNRYLQNAERFRSANIRSLTKQETSIASRPAIVWEYTTTVGTEFTANSTANSVPTINAVQGFWSKKERLYTLALFGNGQNISMTDLKKIFEEITSSLTF